MNQFIVSAFGDEIDQSLDTQMEVLTSHHIKYIEMRGVDKKSIENLTLEEAKVIRSRLELNGFGVSALGSPVGKIGIADPFEPHLAMFKRVLDVAGILQTRFIRIFSFYYPQGEDPTGYAAQTLFRIRTMTELAEEKGIILLHENEKGIYGDHAERCLEIIENINSPNLKITFDAANFIQCDVEPYPHAFQMLRKHIAYIHIKDALVSNKQVMPAGFGDGRILEMLSDLKKDGFHGFLSIEPHLSYFEGMENLEKGLDISRIKQSGREAFGIAFDALKSLLESLEDEH